MVFRSLHQVQFYFSNSNLKVDNFFRNETSKNNGWIAFALLVKFVRLKALSDDCKVIADAVSHSTWLEVDEAKLNVRRTEPYPLDWDPIDSTVLVTGLQRHLSLDEIIAIFMGLPLLQSQTIQSSPSCPKACAVVAVRMKRYSSTGDFTGSAHVQFSSPELAQKVREYICFYIFTRDHRC